MPSLRLASVLVLAACSMGEEPRPEVSSTGSGESGPSTTTSSTSSTSSGEDGSTVSPDGTGGSTDTGEPDCNGPEPGGHPGDPEICDGIDQDCDGEIDEGVPGDGEGCQDLGPPEDPPEIDEIHVTVHTADVEFAGTDDPVEVCFPDIGLCAPLDVADWNDRERGRRDVVVLPGNGATVEQIASMTIGTAVGVDRWEPEGFEVVIDGAPVFCRDELDVYIGTEGGGAELSLWQDPEGFALHCTTVWPQVLTHGPMVGAVGPHTAEIWYRTDATRPVRLRLVPRGEDLATAPVVDHGYPSYLDDHTETVRVVGLTPDTTYDFDLEIEGERFGPWSLHTAPPPGPTSLRVAFGSCAGDDDQPIFASVRAWGPELFLFAGDNHYGNTSDLPSLRQHYRWMRERSDRGQLLHEAAILATWDDHDYVGNNTDGTEPGRAVALEAFREYWANPSYGTDRIPGVFSRHVHGDVEVFLLDDRYYRGLDDSILGDAQEQWLFDALLDSTATFKLVLSGSQFSLLGTMDSWAVFPEAQTRLRAHIADQGIEGVVFLSGDIHRSELRLLPPTAGGYPIPELTSSPMARGTSSCPTGQAELLSCFGGSDYFIGVEIDTTLDDPELVATIYDVGGLALDSWTIVRSSLQ